MWSFSLPSQPPSPHEHVYPVLAYIPIELMGLERQKALEVFLSSSITFDFAVTDPTNAARVLSLTSMC